MVRREHIFETDEMIFQDIEGHWTKDQLLGKKCLFFFKGVCDFLQLDSAKVKKIAKEKGFLNAWKEMGVRKIWSHWIVRMIVFQEYYKKYLIPKYRKIEDGWNANQLLERGGVFLLGEACKILPFRVLNFVTELSRKVKGRGRK